MQENNLPILIVEDDQDLLNLYVRLLSKDYQVLAASTAKEGFKVFQENPEIAVVLTDVLMETEIAGIDLINKIVKLKPATQPSQTSRFNAYKNGGQSSIHPVSRNCLAGRSEKAFRKRSMAKPNMR